MIIEVLPIHTTLAEALDRIEEYQAQGYENPVLDLTNCAIIEE